MSFAPGRIALLAAHDDPPELAGIASRLAARLGAPLAVLPACPAVAGRAGAAAPDDPGADDRWLEGLRHEGIGLVVKAAGLARPGLRGLRDLDRRLVHELGAAVLLVRAGGAHPLTRVAAALVGSGGDEDHRVLDAAAALAGALGAELHVVHAIHTYTHTAGELARAYSEEAAALAAAEERDRIRRGVAAWVDAAGLPLAPARLHTVAGPPDLVLAAATRELRLDALVVGGPRRPRSVWSRLACVAGAVVASAPGSVLVVPRAEPGRRPATPGAPGDTAR